MNEKGIVSLFATMESFAGKLDCPYYPCHFEGQDCSFCYCIFYPCFIFGLGGDLIFSKERYVWSCKNCRWIHEVANVEEVILYFSSFPRQVIVEANWRFFNEALQEILFGKKLGYKIGEAYNLIPANFAMKSFRVVEDGKFLALKLKNSEIVSVREMKSFEGLGDEILIPMKLEGKLLGFDGKNYIECDI